MNITLNHSTCLALLGELADGGPEARIGKALRNWLRRPCDATTAHFAAVWATERDQISDDRRRALLAIVKGTTATRGTATHAPAPAAQPSARDVLLAAGRLHDHRPPQDAA